jgi:hypothetical protein
MMENSHLEQLQFLIKKVPQKYRTVFISLIIRLHLKTILRNLNLKRLLKIPPILHLKIE